MMDILAWWVGMLVLSFLALGVMISLITILYRAYLATLDLACGLIRVRRKRLPRHKWACTPWEAWCWSFWNARASDVHEKAWDLLRAKPVDVPE